MGPIYNGLITSVSYPFLLTGGERYYTTVYAYNNLQMVTSSSSKGFVVDTEPPISGTVYTNVLYQNRRFHTSMFQGSWIGFHDKDSYIKEYYYRVVPYEEKINSTLGFGNRGIETEVELLINNLETELCLQVFAVDAAGFKSDIITSEPFWVDTTPPEAPTCLEWLPHKAAELCCRCSDVIKGHHLEICECSTAEYLELTPATMYNFRIQLEQPLSVSGYFEVNGIISNIYFERIGYKKYLFQKPYFVHKAASVRPLLRFQKHLLVDVGMMYNLSLDLCQSVKYIRGGNRTTAVNLKQEGTSQIHIDYTAVDTESFIREKQVRILYFILHMHTVFFSNKHVQHPGTIIIIPHHFDHFATTNKAYYKPLSS